MTRMRMQLLCTERVSRKEIVSPNCPKHALIYGTLIIIIIYSFLYRNDTAHAVSMRFTMLLLLPWSWDPIDPTQAQPPGEHTSGAAVMKAQHT